MNRRRHTLLAIGASLVAGGLYEALCDPLRKPSITQIGERCPELAGALCGALAAHFFALRREN